MAKKIEDLPTKTILAFWKLMIARHPNEFHHGKAKPEGVRWHYLDRLPLLVSLTVGIDFVRLFIRGEENADHSALQKYLAPWESDLVPLLGVPLKTNEKGRFFSSRFDTDMTNIENWDDAADWLWKRANEYEASLTAVLSA